MILVFDMGGTKTRLALVDNGRWSEIITIPTDRSAAGFAKFLGALQELAEGHKINAIAGGVPGQLRGEAGEFLVATNLPEWRGMPILERIKELFDCPVYVTNDVEMGGLGESKYGAGTEKGVMAYYTISTGVNAVRIVDGVIDTTISRYEIGKQVVEHARKQAIGLEPLVGGAALEKRLGKSPHDVKDPQVWEQVAEYLAAGLYNTTLFWNPQLIVLGGSMMRDIDVERVAEAMEQLPAVFDEWPKLVKATLGDEAGLRGALARLEQLGYR
jgi:glucokinase